MEKKIIDLISAKDEAGLCLLQDEYGRLLRYIISTIIPGKDADIEECLNDVYLKAWNNAEKFDFEKASLKTYLVVIARNQAKNRLRDVTTYDNKIISTDFSELSNVLKSSEKTAEEHVIANENIRALQGLIVKLKGKNREVLERRYFYMQDSQTIAAMMNMSVSAVDNRLYKIRKKLKAEYDQLME